MTEIKVALEIVSVRISIYYVVSTWSTNKIPLPTYGFLPVRVKNTYYNFFHSVPSLRMEMCHLTRQRINIQNSCPILSKIKTMFSGKADHIWSHSDYSHRYCYLLPSLSSSYFVATFSHRQREWNFKNSQ